MRQELKDALVRRALGYDTEEIVEEYREEEGEPLLIKRKVTKKSVPPISPPSGCCWKSGRRRPSRR